MSSLVLHLIGFGHMEIQDNLHLKSVLSASAGIVVFYSNHCVYLRYFFFHKNVHALKFRLDAVKRHWHVNICQSTLSVKGMLCADPFFIVDVRAVLAVFAREYCYGVRRQVEPVLKHVRPAMTEDTVTLHLSKAKPTPFPSAFDRLSDNGINRSKLRSTVVFQIHQVPECGIADDAHVDGHSEFFTGTTVEHPFLSIGPEPHLQQAITDPFLVELFKCSGIDFFPGYGCVFTSENTHQVANGHSLETKVRTHGGGEMQMYHTLKERHVG